uniref:BY PROTMAP: gi/472581954/gb/EMS19662.1/ cytochrome P450, family 4, subfamily A [Rhodosporidium toruloides NP11] gi/647395001/emb/CDR36237.1/ RHTO0S01e17238g1_1 [Rhodosporidium toruloides] n=1 Tax=Rhodotorula toruloides TaxID=5286 RepID=A0A0K3C7U6_RHOTO
MHDALTLTVEPYLYWTLAAVLIALLATLILHALELDHPHSVGSKARPDLYEPKGAIPLLGHTLLFLRNSRRLSEFVLEAHAARRRDGVEDGAKAVSMTLLGGRLIWLDRPEHLEYIQRTNFANYEKGRHQRDELGVLLGEGIFAWSMWRKITARAFTVNSYRNVMSASIHHLTKLFIRTLEAKASEGAAIDLSALLFALTLDTFTSISFSKNPGSLPAAARGETNAFAQAFDDIQVLLAGRMSTPFFWLVERLDGTSERIVNDMKVIHAYADEIIYERVEKVQQLDEDGNLDMLGRYMAATKENGEPLTTEQLRDATINLLIAGRDTTAGTLAWTIFELLRNPALIEGIRRDAAELDDPTELPFDSLKEMNWTSAVFYEGARLYPTVPNNHWTARGEDQIPNGPKIQGGDHIAWSDWTIARDPAVWGPSAGAFDPNRWLDEDGKFRKDPRLHSFNGGFRRKPSRHAPARMNILVHFPTSAYRSLAGETLAHFEAVATLLALFSRFDLSFAPGYLESTPMVKTEWCEHDSPKYRPALTLPMEYPLRVVAKKREGGS